MAKVIKGKYEYHDKDKMSKKAKKKEAKKLQEKMLKKQDKAIKMQCDCNHIDRKTGKSFWKISKDGNTKTCKICGGEIINNPEFFTKDSVESSAKVIYTLLSIIRNKLNIDEETDRQITKSLLIVLRSGELYDLAKSASTGKKKKDKKKNKKNKKNGKSYNRLSY